MPHEMVKTYFVTIRHLHVITIFDLNGHAYQHVLVEFGTACADKVLRDLQKKTDFVFFMKELNKLN